MDEIELEQGLKNILAELHAARIYKCEICNCVAAKELKRRYLGIEIDEEYHKISVDRLNGILANGQMSFEAYTEEKLCKNLENKGETTDCYYCSDKNKYIDRIECLECEKRR